MLGKKKPRPFDRVFDAPEFGEPAHVDNIQLNYRVMIYILNHEMLATIFYADGIEVFRDEHGIQWAKFFAKNGPDPSQEHIIRTDNILIVRAS